MPFQYFFKITLKLFSLLFFKIKRENKFKPLYGFNVSTDGFNKTFDKSKAITSKGFAPVELQIFYSNKSFNLF